MEKNDLYSDLRRLKLIGMAQQWQEMEESLSATQHTALEQKLRQMIRAEEAERKSRSIRYPMGVAKFPLSRNLDEFDFPGSAVDQPIIERLHQGEFTQQAHNLLLVGGTGTGKTHLAIAIGRNAIHQGRGVRFYSVVDLVNWPIASSMSIW